MPLQEIIIGGKIMKKLLLVLASLAMIIGLCACGGGGGLFAKPTPTPIPEIDPGDTYHN